MSAFGGLCFWDGRPVPGDQLSTLAEHLRIAGPDVSGTIHPTPWLALQSHLLHFDRLSALEQQPYAFASGSVLTWDGRLDNRDDLLLCLHRSLGPDQTDAAIVAAAYERWGIDALPKFIGDWSLAVWDSHQQRIVLGRDYMGNRPLYYRTISGRLVWATRLEALAACEHLFGMPDDLYIAGFLTDVGNPNDVTPFASARALLPGHVLIACRDHTEVRRYWRYSPETLRYSNADQYGEHLRFLIAEAVRLRLRSTKTVWAHLSGGWDSSTVVSVAQRLIERRSVEAPAIQSMSLISDDPESAEERRFIRAVEHWCGIETTIVPYRGRPLFSEMLGCRVPLPRDVPHAFEAPIESAGDPIVLTGMLGDLTTGKEGGALLGLWEPFDEGRLLAGMRGFVEYAHASKLPVARLFARALAQRFGAKDKRRLQFLATVRSQRALSRNNIAPELLARAQARPLPARPSVLDFPRAHQQVVESLYSWADRGTLRSPEHYRPSIWRTHPFAHRPLIQFLLAVPPLSLFDPSFSRAGMRRALVDILPPALLERTSKVGYVQAAAARAGGRGIERFRDGAPLDQPLTEWSLVRRGVLASSALADDIRILRQGGAPTPFLYRCVCIEAWLRTLAATTTARPPAFASAPEASGVKFGLSSAASSAKYA